MHRGGMQRAIQKIRENDGMRKAEERMKERETAIGVEKAEGLSV
jgi:hypothetical protein